MHPAFLYQRISMKAGNPVPRRWFQGDTLFIARKLIGMTLCRRLENGSISRLLINETEAYDGPEDLACHAHTNRRTKRTSVMFERGGVSYIYLCYGIHWLMNIVTGPSEYPAAVLIRGAGPYDGPGKLTKALKLDGNHNHKSLTRSNDIWIEEPAESQVRNSEIQATPRIGIDYAGPYWSQVEYRFVAKRSPKNDGNCLK